MSQEEYCEHNVLAYTCGGCRTDCDNLHTMKRERDEALAVLRVILADYNDRQWVDVDVADRARALLAKAGGEKEGKG